MPRFRLRGLMALVAASGIAFALIRRHLSFGLDWALASAWPSAIGVASSLAAFVFLRAFRRRGLTNRRRRTVKILVIALAVACLLAIRERYNSGLGSAMIVRGMLIFDTRSCPDAALLAFYSLVGAAEPVCGGFEPVNAGPDRLLILNGIIATLAGGMGYCLGLLTAAGGVRDDVSNADNAASPEP